MMELQCCKYRMHLRHPKGVVILNKALGDNTNCTIITALVKDHSLSGDTKP